MAIIVIPNVLQKVPIGIYTHEIMKKIDVKQSYIDLVKECGKDNTLYTFEYCSNFGIELNNSTIDEISIVGDDVLFIYNANKYGDFDFFETFSICDLIGFYNGLIDAIECDDYYED